jgi:hypothetical protein
MGSARGGAGADGGQGTGRRLQPSGNGDGGVVRCFAALLGGAERSETPVLRAAVEQYEERLLGAGAVERPKHLKDVVPRHGPSTRRRSSVTLQPAFSVRCVGGGARTDTLF